MKVRVGSIAGDYFQHICRGVQLRDESSYWQSCIWQDHGRGHVVDRGNCRDCYVFFFFSSRRRHTRFDCDWSSDVCSSDLAPRSAKRPRLRALSGADEFLIEAGEPRAATLLLRRLLVDGEDVDALNVAEYDRQLAEVFDALYGDRVEARTRCSACAEPLEISLSLAALAAAPPDVEIDLSEPDEGGVFGL